MGLLQISGRLLSLKSRKSVSRAGQALAQVSSTDEPSSELTPRQPGFAGSTYHKPPPSSLIRPPEAASRPLTVHAGGGAIYPLTHPPLETWAWPRPPAPTHHPSIPASSELRRFLPKNFSHENVQTYVLGFTGKREFNRESGKDVQIKNLYCNEQSHTN